jgi:hypothetical protein
LTRRAASEKSAFESKAGNGTVAIEQASGTGLDLYDLRSGAPESLVGLEKGWMDRDHSTEAARATPGGERTEHALKFYSVVEKLPPEAHEALERFIELLCAEQKKTKRRKKKSDSLKR